MIKLMNGDCLENMDQLIADGVKVDAIITDPPFNIVEKIGPNIHLFRQASKQKQSTITRENMAFDVGFDQFAWLDRIPKILNKGGNLIIFNDWANKDDFWSSNILSPVSLRKQYDKLVVKMKQPAKQQKVQMSGGGDWAKYAEETF